MRACVRTHAHAPVRIKAPNQKTQTTFQECLRFLFALSKNFSNLFSERPASNRNFSSCVISPSDNALSNEVVLSLFLKKLKNCSVIFLICPIFFVIKKKAKTYFNNQNNRPPLYAIYVFNYCHSFCILSIIFFT